MTSDWGELLDRILNEPKPPVTGVCRDNHEGLSISVIHDGDRSWRLDDGSRTYITDGTAAVLAEKGRITRYHGVHVYCMPLPQMLIHPGSMHDISGPGSVTGRVEYNQRSAVVVRMPDWKDGVEAELAVDLETGILLTLRRLDEPDHPADWERLSVGEAVDPAAFQWPWEVDAEVRR